MMAHLCSQPWRNQRRRNRKYMNNGTGEDSTNVRSEEMFLDSCYGNDELANEGNLQEKIKEEETHIPWWADLEQTATSDDEIENRTIDQPTKNPSKSAHLTNPLQKSKPAHRFMRHLRKLTLKPAKNPSIKLSNDKLLEELSHHPDPANPPQPDIINCTLKRPSKIPREIPRTPTAAPIQLIPKTHPEINSDSRLMDVVDLLNNSSLDEPANIPMVITRDVVLRSTGSHSCCCRDFILAMGNVVNGVHKADEWLFVRTAQGTEGYIPYVACLPLGIRPSGPSSDPWAINNWRGTKGFASDGSTFDEKLRRRVILTGKISQSINLTEMPSVSAEEKPADSGEKPATLEKVCVSDERSEEKTVNEKLSNVEEPTKVENKTDTQKLIEFSDNFLGNDGINDTKISDIDSDDGKGDDIDMTTIVVCNYVKKNEGQVTVRRGDVVTVVEYVCNDDWLRVRTDDQRIGLIPTAYTELGRQMFF